MALFIKKILQFYTRKRNDIVYKENFETQLFLYVDRQQVYKEISHALVVFVPCEMAKFLVFFVSHAVVVFVLTCCLLLHADTSLHVSSWLQPTKARHKFIKQVFMFRHMST